MHRSLTLGFVLSLAVSLVGCPKPTSTTVAGTDDEQMDQLSAQLEELRTRTDLQCNDWCSLKSKVCTLSQQSCDLAGKAPDRADFQKRCVLSQEECARFNESCSTCSK